MQNWDLTALTWFFYIQHSLFSEHLVAFFTLNKLAEYNWTRPPQKRWRTKKTRVEISKLCRASGLAQCSRTPINRIERRNCSSHQNIFHADYSPICQAYVMAKFHQFLLINEWVTILLANQSSVLWVCPGKLCAPCTTTVTFCSTAIILSLPCVINLRICGISVVVDFWRSFFSLVFHIAKIAFFS